MNILYVLNDTYLLGGATKSFLTLIESVLRKGHTPIVVTPDEKGVATTLLQMGVEIIAVPYRNNTYPDCRNFTEALLFLPRLAGRRWLIHKAVQKVYEQVKTQNIALVHTNVSVVDVGERVAKKLGVPHIYHIREYADLDFNFHYYPSSKAFHKELSQSYTICITHAIQEHHHQAGNPKSIVVYNGISMEVEKEKHTLPPSPYFLYAGRIEETKGLMDLITAYTQFAQSSDSEIPVLAVAGAVTDANFYKNIAQYLEQKDVRHKTIFLGPRQDIGHLMRHAIATIVPSRFEGFGRCLPEAMLCGCITIGRDTAGTKEQYDNGLLFTGKEIGFRFHNTDELTQCLRRVCTTNNAKLQDMRERATRTINEYYTQQRYTDTIIHLYENIKRESNH